jgi:hypothetical protein
VVIVAQDAAQALRHLPARRPVVRASLEAVNLPVLNDNGEVEFIASSCERCDEGGARRLRGAAYVDSLAALVPGLIVSSMKVRIRGTISAMKRVKLKLP